MKSFSGTGLDSRVLLLYLGAPVPITSKLFFLPSGTYYDSFSEGDLGMPFSAFSIETGFLWFPTPRWWLNFTPSVYHENGTDTEVFIYDSSSGESLDLDGARASSTRPSMAISR